LQSVFNVFLRRHSCFVVLLIVVAILKYTKNFAHGSISKHYFCCQNRTLV
jgi:hypothetical protein